ncbi:hypothetical protein XELAEV_180369832mg, partial [Xenopus laevis]
MFNWHKSFSIVPSWIR